MKPLPACMAMCFRRLVRSARTVGLLATTTALLLGCGGGSGGTTAAGPSGADAGAMSSGSITAFGSVFVNGHEFDTAQAQVIDDDTGQVSGDTSALEVGMSVDLRASPRSSARSPAAAEIHVHPLVRGIVDAVDGSASTLTVMGQVVQVNATTLFSDHRACLSALTTPCSAVTGLSDLVATSGSGATLVAGRYVSVHGFLFDAGSGAHVVASLVVVDDAPASGSAIAAYKVEGVVGAATGSQLTIGGLQVDLGVATCRVRGAAAACASAFAVGQVVSAIATAAPALPALSFTADAARLRGRVAVETAGATVELEGRVSAVDAPSHSFTLRGLRIDMAALAGASLPAVGDALRVVGSVSADGSTVTASSVRLLHRSLAAVVGIEADATGVSAGSVARSWTLTLLGQTVTVDAGTRLLDLSVKPLRKAAAPAAGAASGAAFNIDSFQSYLAASASQHLVVRSAADEAGAHTALSVAIVPASGQVAVAGLVEATPAPVLSTGSPVPTTFSVHGVAVSADPGAIVSRRAGLNPQGLQVGDFVLARGALGAGSSPVITVPAPATGTSPRANAIVIDFGPPVPGSERDCF